MSFETDLHDAHKARLRRIASAAVKPPAPPVVVSAPAPAPVVAPFNLDAVWADRQRRIYKDPWFQIVDGPKVFEPAPLKVEDIQRVVCAHYTIERNALLSPRRTQNVVRPRQIAMYLCKKLTQKSLPEIGRRFGGRDHTTVLHAVRKIEWLIGEDDDVAATVADIRRKCEAL